MDNVQIKLVYLLSCAIRGKRVKEVQLENVDWNQLLKYADSHNIKAIIYSALPKSNTKNYIDSKILEKWKRETIMTAIYQSQNLRQVENLIQKFNERNIPLIVLKGLVIRELYPIPDLRTMGDADILFRESDLYAVKELMEDAGYFEVGDPILDITYENINHNRIEVHWTILHHRLFKSMNDLESKMWDASVKVGIGKSEALCFSVEDLAIHLCQHMATHMLGGGFGLRQLCDLVLLIEKKGDLIDWATFYEKLKNWKIEKFATSILVVCNKLFSLIIPKEFERYCDSIDFKLIEQLIEEILYGGVYGKRDLTNRLANEIAYEGKGEQGNNLIRIIRKFMLLIFPPISKTSEKYRYVKRYKILIPVAWVHRLFSGITHDEFGAMDKISFFIKTIPISLKRNKLFKDLGF